MNRPEQDYDIPARHSGRDVKSRGGNWVLILLLGTWESSVYGYIFDTLGWMRNTVGVFGGTALMNRYKHFTLNAAEFFPLCSSSLWCFLLLCFLIICLSPPAT